LLAAFL